jgi:hypothetical protein
MASTSARRRAHASTSTRPWSGTSTSCSGEKLHHACSRQAAVRTPFMRDVSKRIRHCHHSCRRQLTTTAATTTTDIKTNTTTTRAGCSSHRGAGRSHNHSATLP